MIITLKLPQLPMPIYYQIIPTVITLSGTSGRNFQFFLILFDLKHNWIKVKRNFRLFKEKLLHIILKNKETA